MVAGLALRFATLAHQSFWEDETLTAWQAHLPFDRFVEGLPDSEASPPLYFLLVWPWSRLFGGGEAGIRSFSAAAGTLTIPVVFLCARQLLSVRAGLIAALLAAASPALIWYSQEARPYALMILLTTCSLLFFVRALEAGQGRARELNRWAIVSCLAMATHYFAWFAVGTEGAWLAIALLQERRREGRRTTLADTLRPLLRPTVVVALAAVALLPLLYYQRVSGGGADLGFIGDNPLADRLKDAGAEFVYGADRPPINFLPVIEVVALAALALLCWRGDRAARRAAAIPLGVAALLVVEPWVLDVAGLRYIDQRNLLVALTPLIVGIAIALAAPGIRVAAVALLAVAVGTSLTVLVLVQTDPTIQREDWRGAARVLGPASRDRIIVVAPDLANPRPLPPLVALEGFYRRDVRQLPRHGASVAEIDVLDVRGSPSDQAPVASPRAPARGFRLLAHRTNGNYNLFRFVAPGLVHVTPHALAGEHLLDRDATIALQRTS